jgi:hypothetical protein
LFLQARGEKKTIATVIEMTHGCQAISGRAWGTLVVVIPKFIGPFPLN